jgi:hypothetical protein
MRHQPAAWVIGQPKRCRRSTRCMTEPAPGVTPIDEGILMLRILACQVIAAILGTASIGAADWLYHRQRIRQRPHDLWVSASSTAICLPLLIWTTGVFLGFGVFSQMLIAAVAAIVFLWLYRSLRKVPAEQQFEWGVSASRPSKQPVFTGNITRRAERRRVEDALPR